MFWEKGDSMFVKLARERLISLFALRRVVCFEERKVLEFSWGLEVTTTMTRIERIIGDCCSCCKWLPDLLDELPTNQCLCLHHSIKMLPVSSHAILMLMDIFLETLNKVFYIQE